VGFNLGVLPLAEMCRMLYAACRLFTQIVQAQKTVQRGRPPVSIFIYSTKPVQNKQGCLDANFFWNFDTVAFWFVFDN
jgi:hypothetical protein